MANQGDISLWLTIGAWQSVRRNAWDSAFEVYSPSSLTNFTEAINTSAPNVTVPVVSFTATNAATDVDVVLAAKGTWALLAQVPNNLSSGGNKRGASAVDLQKGRTANTQVASWGNAIAMGDSNTASGLFSVTVGSFNVASNDFSVAIGDSNTVSGNTATALGYLNTSSGIYASSFGNANTASWISSVAFGSNNTANSSFSTATWRYATTNTVIWRKAHNANLISAAWESQKSEFILTKRTTNATPSAVTVDGWAVGTANQVILPNSSAYSFSGMVVARQQASAGAISASWEIKGLIIRNANAASTSIVSSSITAISNVSALEIALTADTTNWGITLTATGLAATNIMWVATIDTSEVIYA